MSRALLAVLVSSLLAVPALAKSRITQIPAGMFMPARRVSLVDKPGGSKAVGTVEGGRTYKLLKKSGADNAWCELKLPATAGWLRCSEAMREPVEPTPAPAPQPAPTPGGDDDAKANFAYYLVTLSWSPTWCETAGTGSPAQCGADRHFGFVLHGLWPENEQGYPSDCATGAPDSALIASMRDIMPFDDAVIGHEWTKHGTCSGLTPANYFTKARAGFVSIQTPEALKGLKSKLVIDLPGLEKLLADANPGLTGDQVAVQCTPDGELKEIRVCTDKQLHRRACSADVTDRCTGPVSVPPTP